MSRGNLSGNEKCIFCGWTRRNAYQSVRFFCIPKEPGLKRVRWLQTFGEREITSKDRVCSVHFRQGRPSSDASHEDFVPHLYLNNEPPPEVLDYLESLADAKPERNAASTDSPTTTKQPKVEFPYNPPHPHVIKTSTTRSTKPSILKRKRRAKESPEIETTNESPEVAAVVDEPSTTVEPTPPPPSAPTRSAATNFEDEQRPIKLTLIRRQIVDAAGLKPGQTVIIRRVVKK
ncbi:hypothetical protein M3Y94_00135400 [Aphelenchoides besseyi]|nr:hypothetical protein M3Y94_00135400 [Aphelenchoides besseyi]KAI6237302.1 THAP-type domain-containing protein [Aphelenchoides besseyi]